MLYMIFQCGFQAILTKMLRLPVLKISHTPELLKLLEGFLYIFEDRKGKLICKLKLKVDVFI